MLFIFGLVYLFSPSQTQRKSNPTPAGKPSESPEIRKAEPVIPAYGTPERVKYEMEKALGKAYRAPARIWDIHVTPQNITVGFYIEEI
jgi:hypothetical protein